MDITRYHTARGIPKVKAVKVDKDTDKSVVINGRRRAKRGNWDNYFDTFDEAKVTMVDKARANVKGCTMRLKEAETFLHKAQNIRRDSV
ncbi:MAG: hypothetical protein V3U75_06475 [Methylococcaceae bacterium]